MSENQENFFVPGTRSLTHSEIDRRIHRQTIGFVMSVRPHGTTRFTLDGFSRNLIILRKSDGKFQVSSKSDKNYMYFIWRTVYIYDNIWLNSS